MAIKDTSKKPYIQDIDTRVKIGIDLPIRRIYYKLMKVRDFFNPI